MSDQPASSEASLPSRDEDPPTWAHVLAEPVVVAPFILVDSGDRRLSVLFEDLDIRLDAHTERLREVRCAALAAFTYVGSGMRVRIEHSMEGIVSLDAGARATVTGDFGGVAHTTAFPFNAPIVTSRLGEMSNDVELQPDQSYLMTFTLTVERRSRDAAVVFALKTVELYISPLPPPPAETE